MFDPAPRETPALGASIMHDFARDYLLGLGRVEIIVAVPSYHNAATVAGVASAAGAALARDFPTMRGLVLNADGDPLDNTPFVFNSAVMPPGVQGMTMPYLAPPGRGNALRLISEVLEITGATVCVLLDPALEDPDPSWVRILAGPILEGAADLVTPIYRYRPFDDLPARLLVQPLALRLVSGDWAAPAATDMAFSGEFGVQIRATLPDDPAVQGAGADFWLAYNSLLNGKHIAQVGPLYRDRFARDPAVPLDIGFAQLVATAFDLGATPPATRVPAPPSLQRAAAERELKPVEATLPALIARFKLGALKSRDLWARVLAADNLATVLALAAGDYKGAAARSFRFPTELWVAIIFEWLAAWRTGSIVLDDLLLGLGPLFHGFAASHVAQARGDTGQ